MYRSPKQMSGPEWKYVPAAYVRPQRVLSTYVQKRQHNKIMNYIRANTTRSPIGGDYSDFLRDQESQLLELSDPEVGHLERHVDVCLKLRTGLPLYLCHGSVVLGL